jgi:N-acetyl-alpha-D-muramate 1-phosphate uridylyltransferase
MVLAAGLGTRMKPLTDRQPKALVEVAGKPLIDHVLDRLGEAGVETAVVNVHHFADEMEAHLARRARNPAVLISDERAGLLDSGGGIAKARPALGEAPIMVANIDSLWLDGAQPPLETLKAAWDPEIMDLCLLLVPRANAMGYDSPRGFFRDAAGRLTHSAAVEPQAPLANMGFGILKPQILDGSPAGAFPIEPIWRRLSTEGRLYGAVMDGFWMHVGDPAAREAAEARLR